MRKTSFTLIELLVVVAMIAVLVAILLPALSMVRERGRQIACLAKLRDVGLRFECYMQDHADVYPPAFHTNGTDYLIDTPWNACAMRSYFVQPADTILQCPTATASGAWRPSSGTGPGTSRRSRPTPSCWTSTRPPSPPSW